ncbi:MAG: hypothetical protein JXR70_02990, partial [Spirochaetales bacterium]|nr:hypothetical protein [Spirochaetales bacterium]
MKIYKHLRVTILLLVICFFSQNSLFSQTSSQIPGGANNYLQVANTLTAGGYDEYVVIFFEIPDTVTSTLNFAVYDPDMSYYIPPTPPPEIPPPESDSSNANYPWYQTVSDITSYFTLVGGSGTLSDARSRYVFYDTAGGDDPLGAGMGTVLDQIVNTNITSDEGWVYFSGVNPNQGELIGNKRYFKIVVYITTTAGWVKNGFKLDISLNNTGNPTGITGVRSFAYSWPIFLNDVNTWNIYPFVPDTLLGGNIVFSNFDMDTYYPDGFPGIPSAMADLCYVFDKNDTALSSPTHSRDSEYFETSYPVTAGLTNGTWRLQIVEGTDPGSGDGVNLSEFWFTDQLYGGAVVQAGALRAYSSPFSNPPVAADITVSLEDGVAINDNTDTEKIFVQVVDSNGDPAPYSRNVWVQLSGSAVIDSANAFYSGYFAGTNSALITTSSEGLGWVTARNSVVESVSVQFAVNGTTTPGTDSNEASFSSTVQSLSVDFVSNPDPLMSSASNLSFTNAATGTTLDLPMITITEIGSTSITNTANSLVVRIPSGLSVLFDTGFAPVFGGTVGVTGSTLETGRLIITPSANFNSGDTLTISGLRFDAASDSPSSGKLELSYTGTGGSFSVVDDKIITISDFNPNFVWDGSTSTDWATGTNWIGDAAPSAATDNVIIPNAGGNMPILSITTTLQSLYIESGASLTFSGTDLNISGILTVHGSLVMNGNLNVGGNIVGNGLLNASTGGAVGVTGNLTVASYSSTANTTIVGGNWGVSNFTANSGTVEFNGT